MLKSWPCNKNLATGAMFRISRKCFPAKHGKAGFPTTSHRSELDHTSSESESPHRVHLLGRITGRISLQLIFSYFFNVGLMKLILFAKSFEARNWNYIVNQRKKGVSRNDGVKYLWVYEYLRRQVILEVQQLFTISRFRASGEVGP